MIWMAAIMASMAIAAGSPAQAPEPATALARVEGDWDGTLVAGAVKLRLALHIHIKDGVAIATIDSPDQGASGLPANLAVDGDHVQVAPKAGGGGFDGALSPNGASLAGHWGPGQVTFTRRDR